MDWKRLLIGNWNWKRPFISLASIYLILAVTACSFADKLIFQPPPSSYTTGLDGFEMIKPTETEPIALVHLKASPGAPTLLYSHGNAEDIGQNMEIFREWQARGFGVIAYDYPGYGLSPGSSTEASTQETIRHVWDHAITSGISPSSMVIVGRSIGSGPSLWLASSVDSAGIILISPLKSVYTTAFPLPFPLFPGDRFPNLRRIRKIETPLLVIHGENDKVIPASHGRAIHENSPSNKKSFVSIQDAGHNDLFVVGAEEIFIKTSAFISEVSAKGNTR